MYDLAYRLLVDSCLTDVIFMFIQGAPSFVRLYEYPNLSPAAIGASKSFFRADSVTFFWNKKGVINHCLENEKPLLSQ